MPVLRLLSRLPFPFLYFFSDLMFFFAYHIIRYRRITVDTNLQRSFPEKSSAERKKIARAFFRNLCDYAVETLKLLTMPREEVLKRMQFSNMDLVEGYARNRQSMIYITSHQFNWEWLLAGVCLNSTPPLFYVYQKQSSEFFDAFSNKIRMRFGAHAVPREKVGREVISRKGTLHSVALLADQFPGWAHDKRYWSTFLHQETAFFHGINHLAILTQYPVIFFSCKKVSRGHYRCELLKIAEPPYNKRDFSAIESYISATEKVIRDQPEGWLWSHNRWKKSRKDMGE